MDEKSIENAWKEYMRNVQQYADWRFEHDIKPFLQAREYRLYKFSKSDYAIHNRREMRVYNDELPDHIREILEMDIPGLDTYDLGSLMPEFNWEDEGRANVPVHIPFRRY